MHTPSVYIKHVLYPAHRVQHTRPAACAKNHLHILSTKTLFLNPPWSCTIWSKLKVNKESRKHLKQFNTMMLSLLNFSLFSMQSSKLELQILSTDIPPPHYRCTSLGEISRILLHTSRSQEQSQDGSRELKMSDTLCLDLGNLVNVDLHNKQWDFLAVPKPFSLGRWI